MSERTWVGWSRSTHGFSSTVGVLHPSLQPLTPNPHALNPKPQTLTPTRKPYTVPDTGKRRQRTSARSSPMRAITLGNGESRTSDCEEAPACPARIRGPQIGFVNRVRD